MAASSAVHCRLVINGEYWGLYLAAESIEKGFVQRTFGGSEDGNLFKAVPHRSDLLYAGPDQADYEDDYELVTNESTNDWTDLLDFINVLNNSADEDFKTELSGRYDVEGWLTAAAANALLGNYDAYGITANNFYLYHRDDTDRFVYIPWIDRRPSTGSSCSPQPMVDQQQPLGTADVQPTVACRGVAAVLPAGTLANAPQRL